MSDVPEPGTDATEVLDAMPVGTERVDVVGVEAPTDVTVSPLRVAVALVFPLAGAALMVGGVFTGASARVWALVAGLFGFGVALVARRIERAVASNAVVVIGLFAIGLVVTAFTGVGNVFEIRALAQQAAASGDVLRPPVGFSPGWQAIVGWLMGIVGFVTLWLGTAVGKRSMALLVPLPFAALAGISVPEDAQTASGIAVLVLFAVGLGLLSSVNAFEGSERPPVAYEVRKALRSIPLIAVITVALIALAQTDFLFPDPRIDPAEEAQKPKTVPLDEVEDRVLFEVSNPDGGPLVLSGPWRLGTLDVYDGRDWRLPPFAQSQFEEVADDGVVAPDLIDQLGVKAEFEVQGLGGTVLPGLPNTVAILASGPTLAYDGRTGNIRVAAGQVRSGQTYQIAAAGLPTVEDLRVVDFRKVPERFDTFLEVPDPPPAVRTLLDEAASRFDHEWDRFDFLRTHVLDQVVAAGTGQPVSVPPERVQEVLGETLEASPFEIVAIQALLARWAGIPARIGYGFDGGDLVADRFEVRPKHGASYVEVYFPGYEWLPVTGKPKQAKPTVGADPEQQQLDSDVLPSNELSAQLYLPQVVPPRSQVGERVRNALLAVAAVLLALAAGYVATPAIRKAVVRSRRRTAARRAGARARIALAYAEWRDHAADFGYGYPTDTPLMYLDRFVDDPEQTELAWLTTRALWGDLRDVADDELAGAAEELSRALRRRLSAAQPATMRFVAAVSRISLRDPYAPATDLSGRGARSNGRRHATESRARDDRAGDAGAAERGVDDDDARQHAREEEDIDVPTLV
jgi:hypothetical protein